MALDLDIVGTVGVDVVPIAPLFHQKLRAMILPGADKLGSDLGEAIARAMSIKIADAIPRAVSAGAKRATADAVRQGARTGGAFADSLRAKLEAAFRAMPKLDIGLSDTGVDAQLARLRAKLEDLRNKRIGIDITTEDARAKIQAIDDRLARLGAASANPRVRVDTATARAALAELRAEIDEASRNPLDIRVRVGEFRASLLAKVEAAQAALPAIQVEADTDPARQELDRYRAELATIPVRLRTDADFDDAKALAEIDRIQIKLAELSRNRRVDVDVRADAARAEAELAVIQAEVSALDGEHVALDFGSANVGALELAVNLAALIAIPLVPVLGAGIGGITAALAAAAPAAGAFALAAIPAVKGVTDAMKAQTDAQKDNTSATNAGANAGITAAQRALQMAGAQQALASAHRQAAQSIRSADEQVANAERAVAQATQTAAEQRKQALQGVKAAEQSLADAQRNEKDAQSALTQARADAAQQLADLNNQLADADLSKRAADLQVERTKLALDTAQKNVNTTPIDLEEAQLAYDQALQAQKEQTESQKDLVKSAADQTKAGVDGNKAVMQAAQQLADAQRNVAQQTKAVADAQANVAKVAKSAAQAVADAARQEADAVANAANTRANAADSIASAERGIAQAQLTSSKTTTVAVSKADEYRKALAKLTPEGRKLFDAIAGPKGLKAAFTAWSTSMQPSVLPLLTRAVNGLKNTLPGLTPLVTAASDGIGTLFDKSSKNLKSPFWKGFKQDIATSAAPAIVGLGVAFGNTFKGIAGIIDAFLPHMAGVAAAMDRITARFARWGAGLKGSPAFERFLDYVKANGPGVAHFLGQILSAVTDVSKALSPVAATMFSTLGPLLDALGWLANNAPEVVRTMYALYLMSKLAALGLKLLEIPLGIYNTIVALAGLETWSWAAAIEATGIPALIGLIVAAVAILALGIYELYTRVGWFRATVDASWRAIKVSTLFLWNSVLKPTFHGIEVAISATGDAAVWLWKKAIKPAFDGITVAVLAVGDASVWLWKNAIKPTWNFIDQASRILATVIVVILVAPVLLWLKVMAVTFTWLWKVQIKPAMEGIASLSTWLWKQAIKPSFEGIAAAATWLWSSVLRPTFAFIGAAAVWLYRNVIKPNFDLIVSVMRAVGTAGSWLWNTALKPAFGQMSDGAHRLWEKGFKPQFELIKSGIGAVKTAFDVAKDGIKIAWDKLKDITSTPVKFVVDHVFNEGIRPVWNDVAKITGVKQLDKVDTSKWATGGVLPGFTPGRDPHKFYSPTGGRLELSGGESIMRPEFTAAVGAGFVHAMNGIAASRGVSGVRNAMAGHSYFGGGVIDWLGDAASTVGDTVKGAANGVLDAGKYLANPGKVWDDLIKKITASVSDLGSTDWAKMIGKFPVTIATSLKDKALSSVTDAVIGGGSSPLGGVRQWAPVVQKALSFLNLPLSNVGITLARMNQESGGNPRAVNLWDSNAQAGHPSVGLMQLIRGTWESYAGDMIGQGPYMYGVSVDPFANIYASMRYALARYGSLQSAYGREGGYDDGGWMQPGDWLTYNHTGKPEPVFTADQWSTLRANLEAKNSSPVYAPSILVSVGNERLTEHIDYRVEVHSDRAAGLLNTGRRL